MTGMGALVVRLLAIDPGSEESGWVEYGLDHGELIAFGKTDNHELKDRVEQCAADDDCEMLAIEMIVNYGKPVGKTTFAALVWIGRFIEAWETVGQREEPVELISRQQVKRKLMGGNMRATDSQVRARVIRLYAPTEREAIGLKATPGPLYGVTADTWQALALAVVAAQ